MTTIIDHNIHLRCVLLKLPPEVPVGLVSNKYPDALCLVSSTTLFNVNAVDSTAGTEIAFPHLEAAAAVYADLEDIDRFISEFGEMAIVNLKVMSPLPNPRAGLNAIEIALEITLRSRRGGCLS